MTGRTTLAAVVALLITSTVSSPAAAQALASPRASLMQVVDSTTTTIEYYRPSMRGRRIFGELVPWNGMWTPGANWATTFDVDRDIRIEDHPLPRGKYSLWVIPNPKEWTVVLSRATRRFHVMRPDAADEQLRFSVRPETAPLVEMLTFSFPVVTRTSATLQFHWDRTAVPIHIEVQPSRPALVAAHPLANYAGKYDLRFVRGDSTLSPPVSYEVIDAGTRLRVRSSASVVEPGLDTEFDLEPAGGDDFHPRQYRNGTLVGVEADEIIKFHIEGARATGFDIRGLAEDRLLGKAMRSRP